MRLILFLQLFIFSSLYAPNIYQSTKNISIARDKEHLEGNKMTGVDKSTRKKLQAEARDQKHEEKRKKIQDQKEAKKQGF